MNRLFTIATLVFVAIAGAGCATNYVTPSAGVSLTDITDEDLRDYYTREPSSPFPANIAVIRVQDSGYTTRTSHGYGHGRFSVVTTRDVETDEAYASIVALPLVNNVVPVGRMLLPANASAIKDLRAPAAKLRADLLLVYTIDTTFSVEGQELGPLSLISLGFIPNKKAHVTATVAGVLVDVRTGFIYGTSEATATENQRATVWSTENAIDSSRMRAEKEAFDEFAAEFGTFWKNVVDVHAATMQSPERVTDASDGYFSIRFDGE